MRPHLEYCNTVTYPVYEKDAKLLESVQRRATKMVPGMKNCDYATRLKKLALPSLSYRRKRGDMIEVYKYTHGLYKGKAHKNCIIGQKFCLHHITGTAFIIRLKLNVYIVENSDTFQKIYSFMQFK